VTTTAPTDDELVAIVAAYVIVTREQRRIAAVPAPMPAWRRAARREGVAPSARAPRDRGHRAW
jgi:hypothetical protein